MDPDVGQNPGEKAETSLSLDQEVETQYRPQFEETQTQENQTRPECKHVSLSLLTIPVKLNSPPFLWEDGQLDQEVCIYFLVRCS